jgi:diguanylate cyclase (GGDEF)-like protein/PAS domain S-box-containing protein
MDYKEMTKEQLLQRIEELERLNRELIFEKHQETKLEYAWTGNLGQWYWDMKTNQVTFNPLKVITLGYDEEEIPEHVNYQYFTEKLHPEDYEKAMEAMLDHLHGKAPVYEVEYRIRTKDGHYRWYYDRGKITQRDDKGKPLFLAGIVFDVTERKEMEQELEIKNQMLTELSSVDGLTRIPNHRTLVETLKGYMMESNRGKTPLSIALFDIDNFKSVNDTKGHVFGDQVLIRVAEILTETVRGQDMAGRYGGEEFLVLLPGADVEAAKAIAERIRKNVEEYAFEEEYPITISGGVSSYQGESISDFIQEADSRLYEAKRSGKNKVI